MTREEIKEAVAFGKDLAHRREYEAALQSARRDGPAWDDLTEQQRENVRTENRRYWDELNALGDSIRQGAIPATTGTENNR